MVKYKIAFMGTPDFSVPALKKLIEAGHKIVAVYSQPPRPKDRGHKLTKSPVHLEAEERNIPVFTPLSFKKDPEAVRQFQSLDIDFAIVVAYGLILPKSVLDSPKYGCLNIHGSLLPKWRGAAPIQRAILAGDDQTGITIMQMDEGMDTGDMLLKGECPIASDTTASMLYDQLSDLGADLIVQALKIHTEKGFSPIEQDESLATHAPKLSKEESEISWQMSDQEIDLRLRAFTPWPGIYFMSQNEKIKIHQAEPLSIDHSEPPGTLLDGHDLIVACKQGALKIHSLQRPNRGRVSGVDYIKGQHLSKGSSL